MEQSSVSADQVRQQVREYVLDNFLMGGGKELQDEDSFMDNHIVDSTGFLELVAFLEQAFGFRIEDQEMVPENLDSLSNIARFVCSKTSIA
jgi:acyl carrier protein